MTWNYFECNFIEYKFYVLCRRMRFQRILNFLDTFSGHKDWPRFVTKKWIEVYDESEKNYNPNKEIRIKTSMLRWCDFSDAYVVA